MEKLSENLKEKRVILTRFYEVDGGGGTPPVIEPITITENGTFTAPAGVDGHSPITVDVPAPTGWKSQPDWWDIKAIFESDTDPNKRAIILLTNSLPTFVLNNEQIGNAQAYYKTSDGGSYTGSAIQTHIFDTTKDKPCSLGYKTRWVMVYSSNPSIIINLNNNINNYTKYIYIGNNSIIGSVVIGGSSHIHYLLEAFHCSNNVTALGGAYGYNAFAGSISLMSVDIPNGIQEIGITAFNNCYNLEKLLFPSTVTSIGDNSFGAVRTIREIILPKGLLSIGVNSFINCSSVVKISIPKTLSTIGAASFNAWNSLLYIEIEIGWIAPAFSVSYSQFFPESSAVELFTRLGNAPTARTLTFGSTLLNRWSQSTKDIAINKGYTLA